MQAFRRVVELQSFGAAARSLEMTGGAVSKLVSQLEREIGARLFNRTTRSVRVTEEGAAFYGAVVRILDELDAATEQARAKAATPVGTLRASVPTSFALMWLSRRVPAFLARHPQLRLDLSLNDRFVDLVEEGYDCALRIASQLADSHLVARRLGAAERVLVAAPAYLKRSPALRKPADLAAHDCLVYSETASPGEWPLGGTEQGRPVSVDGSYRVNNSVMLRDMLLAGRGITLTPRFVVDDLLQSGKLVEVLRAHRAPPHNVYGVIAHQRYVAQKVRVFLDFIESELALGPASQ
jgi:DNA-binding transcriptional LysR family regulator